MPFGVTDWDHCATFGWSDENGHPSWLRTGMVVQRIRDWSAYDVLSAERDAALDVEGDVEGDAEGGAEGDGVEMMENCMVSPASADEGALWSPNSNANMSSRIDNVDEPHIVVAPPPCVAFHRTPFMLCVPFRCMRILLTVI